MDFASVKWKSTAQVCIINWDSHHLFFFSLTILYRVKRNYVAENVASENRISHFGILVIGVQTRRSFQKGVLKEKKKIWKRHDLKGRIELVKTLMLCSFSTIGQTAKNIAIETPEIIIPHDNTIISCWCQNSYQIGGLWLKGFIKLHPLPFFQNFFSRFIFYYMEVTSITFQRKHHFKISSEQNIKIFIGAGERIISHRKETTWTRLSIMMTIMYN